MLLALAGIVYGDIALVSVLSMVDGSHLFALVIGAFLAGSGYLLQRAITGAATKEKIDRYSSLADIASKMKAQGLSPEHIAAVSRLVSGKRREVEIAAQNLEVDASIAETIEPEGYWTQGAMNARASAAYNTATAQLHEALLNLSHYLGEDLWEVQAVWEQFRDKQIELARAQFEGGSLAPFIAASEGEALTRQRLAWAQASLEELAHR